MLFHGHAFVILFILIASSSLFYILLGPPFTKDSIQESNFPIHSTFQLPFPLPTWPPGNGFASGYIDLGGLEVRQVSTFKKIWETFEGGPGNHGATFFEPSEIPNGYFMLGSYGQPNSRPLFGSVLVGKDQTNNSTGEQEALKKPIDYTLVWSSQFSKVRQESHGYIWFPVPPDGYEAIGHVVTTTPEKPPLDKVRCVRLDLTDDCELETWIWDEGTRRNDHGFCAYSLRPNDRGTRAQGLSVGAFAFIFMKNIKPDIEILPLSCLKNKKSNFLSMPNLMQIKALFQEYSPRIFLHPKETYLPSSVTWFFANGAKLYAKGPDTEAVPINYSGSNLPQGGLDDETYWLDLPSEKTANEKLKKGDLPSSEAYIHVKSMFGGTFTDITVWIFYPFNGPATAKLGPFNIPLGRIGQHVGDWEHITLRISNFDGMLQKVFFSEHSGGTWVDASFLEFQNGTNKVLAYASLNGHAFYSKPGMVPQGLDYFGIRNDMKRSDLVMDTGNRYVILGADHLGHEIVKPPWLHYAREWGPIVTYNLGILVNMMDNVLIGVYKSAFHNLVNLFPCEILGEEGPVGPKMKMNWKKDEV